MLQRHAFTHTCMHPEIREAHRSIELLILVPKRSGLRQGKAELEMPRGQFSDNHFNEKVKMR